jgi:hypothetical protein
MIEPLRRPELVINSAPILDLRIALAFVQGYENVAPPEYRFEVECRLRHATGSFTYSVHDLCFDLKSFAKFSEELRAMQQGSRRNAALKNVGDMMVFRLEGNSHKLAATLDVRECLAPSMVSVHATLEVDYDLFVNKLRGEMDRFVEELRQIEPLPPEWRKY